ILQPCIVISQWSEGGDRCGCHIKLSGLLCRRNSSQDRLAVTADFANANETTSLSQLVDLSRSNIRRIEFDRFQHIRAEVNRLPIARPHRCANTEIKLRG